MWYNEPIDHDGGVAERKGSSNHRGLFGLWYNEPIDHDSGVAERKGSLNHRGLFGLWYNESIDHDGGVAERKGSLNHRGRACCGEKQLMLYSTEKSTNFTTEFVKMVVESQ